MKINILVGAIVLGSIVLVANGIEENMSYKQGNNTYFDYTIKGNGEECEVTYRENKELTDSTCLSSTNSKGLTIYCTKTKKICKTKKEIDDFVSPSSQDDVFSQISTVLKNWLKAHNNNDMKLLSELYSKELTYYGKKLTRKKCIKDKERALKIYPNFHQSLEEIDYSEVTPNMYKVTFNKLVRLKTNGKLKVYPSYLLIDTSTSSILVEGDDVTDGKVKVKKLEKVKIKKNDIQDIKTPTSQEQCKIAEQSFSKVNKIFEDAQLNPKETSNSTFSKQLKARDSALEFITKCDNVSRNVFWNGGYDIDDVKAFIRQTNMQERLVTDLNDVFK